MGSPGLDRKLPTVQPQENISDEEGRSFIAVDEGMVEYQRLEQSRRQLGKVVVVTGLRSEQCALEESLVADAGRSAKTFDQSLVYRDRFID